MKKNSNLINFFRRRIFFICLGLTATLGLSCKERVSKLTAISTSVCSNQWREVDWKIALFPDLHARYFSMQFVIPKAQKVGLKFEGEFPKSRYMSFHAYNQESEDAISSIYDENILPLENSVNPFVPGTDRSSSARSFSVVASCQKSKLLEDSKNKLALVCDQEKDQLVDIWYRTYLSEEGVKLPNIISIDPISLEPTVCPTPALKEYSIATVQGSQGTREAAEFLQGRVPAPLKNGEIHFYHPVSMTLGANQQVKYLATRLDGKGLIKEPLLAKLAELKNLVNNGVIHRIGNISVLKFKLPSFPDSKSNLRVFSGKDDLRYLSICVSGEQTDASNCLSDGEFKTLSHVNQPEEVILIVGPDNEDIRKKVEARGFNYLQHSTHRAPILFYRQMLARGEFSGKIELVKHINQSDFVDSGQNSVKTQVPIEKLQSFFAEKTIGAYAPIGRQCFYDEDTFFEFYCGMADVKSLAKDVLFLDN